MPRQTNNFISADFNDIQLEINPILLSVYFNGIHPMRLSAPTVGDRTIIKKIKKMYLNGSR